MSMDYFSIGMAETNKRSTASLLPLNTPENKRDIPCDNCSLASECEAKLMECVAIRSWYGKGDFDDSDMGRLRRRMK